MPTVSAETSGPPQSTLLILAMAALALALFFKWCYGPWQIPRTYGKAQSAAGFFAMLFATIFLVYKAFDR